MFEVKIHVCNPICGPSAWGMECPEAGNRPSAATPVIFTKYRREYIV